MNRVASFDQATQQSPEKSSTKNLKGLHWEHLLSEGFMNEQIEYLQAEGLAQSLTEEEAISAGYKVWNGSRYISSSGLLFRFSNTFGQMRCDTLLRRANGKECKYLIPRGSKTQAYIPPEARVVTEGFKDAYAGTVNGGIPTAAIGGTSHYRCLPENSKLVMLYDSDGWSNPSVFLNLFNAGKYLNGKVQLLPPIPGEPKGGLCEYFKWLKEESRDLGAEYKNLIDAAMAPEALLMKWGEYFKDIPDHRVKAAVQVAMRLAAGHLDASEQDILIERIAAKTSIKKKSLRNKLRYFQQIISQSKISKLNGNQSSEQHVAGHEEDPYEVRTTPEDWFYVNVFTEGKGDWCVLDDSFYKYGEYGQWCRVDDAEVNKIVTIQLRQLYRAEVTKQGISRKYCYSTKNYLQSTTGFCRSGLHQTPPDNIHLRSFRNGVLNLASGELVPHAKDYYLTSFIDAEYHKTQECPDLFERFIISSYGTEMLPLIRACTSMLLDPTAPWGKFPYLVGESGSGKGTLVRFWQSLFGEKHVRSSCSFNDVSSPELRHQHLSGVSIFALPDIGGYQQGLKAFYELVDNGSMSGRALFQSYGYQKRWNTRFLVASVMPIRVENSGDGWDRRAIPLPTLPKHLRPHKPDTDLEAKLQQPDVKAGVIAWALSMDKEERKKILLDPSEFCDRVLQIQYETSIMGDPVKAFVDHCLRPSDSGTIYLSVELHDLFCRYADAFGYNRIGEKNFTGHLRTILSCHYHERRRMTKDDPGFVKKARDFIPAQWANIRVVDALSNGTLNKSLLKEGGLCEFREWSEENGSNGSNTHGNHMIQNETPETLSTQGTPKNGSNGSNGSNGYSPHTREKNKKNGGGVESISGFSEISPISAPQPSDPFDPNFETLTIQGLEVDHMGKNGVSDPFDPFDPNCKARRDEYGDYEPAVIEAENGMLVNVRFVDGSKRLVRKSEVQH